MRNITNVKMEERVCEALKALGVNACLEYQDWISIPVQGGGSGGEWEWAFGTANKNWSGDLNHDNEPETTVELPFASNHESDGKDIALAIVEAIREKPLPSAEKLAVEFCKQLRAYLSAEHFKELQDKTNLLLLDEEKNGPAGHCHSHDHCDANQIMLNVWEKFFGVDSVPACIREDATEEQQETDDALWNKAWSLAKRSGFSLDEPTKKMTKGSVVKYSQPNAGEECYRFILMNDPEQAIRHGKDMDMEPSVELQLICRFKIKPVERVALSEVCAA